MMEWLDKVKRQPVVAHWLAAFERFNGRLGIQFAAAITYFSVLWLLPLMMVAFAVVGLTVTVFVPDLLDQIKDWITDAVASQAQLGDQLTKVVDQAFGAWQAVGIVGLLAAGWTGSRWVANIRSAVRAQMRADFDTTEKKANIVVQTLIDVASLLGIFALVAVTLALSTSATYARGFVGQLLGLEGTVGGEAVLSLVPLAASLLAGFLLFLFIFALFPEKKAPTLVLVQGAALGAVGMAALQYVSGILIGVFAGNAASAVFGSAIVVMLFFNLFATLILIVAAWIATHPRMAPDPVQLAIATPAQPTDYATKVLAAHLNDDTEKVPREVAVRAARLGLGSGAVVGAGVAGIIAALAAALSGWRERRR